MTNNYIIEILPLPSITATINEWLSRTEAEVLGRRIGKLDEESSETLVEGLVRDLLEPLVDGFVRELLVLLVGVDRYTEELDEDVNLIEFDIILNF